MFALRTRLFKERQILPSLVIGANDAITSSEGGNQFFELYVVATKHFIWSQNKFGPYLGVWVLGHSETINCRITRSVFFLPTF